MRHLVSAAAAATLLAAAPALAQGTPPTSETVQVVMTLAPGSGRMSSEQLLALASERNLCGGLSPVQARTRFWQPGTVSITCANPSGFVPLVGLAGATGVGAAVGVGALLAAFSGGSSPSTTPSTN